MENSFSQKGDSRFHSPLRKIYRNVCIHYDINEENKRTIQSIVSVKKDNFKEWISFFDLFVYCTKRSAVMLPLPDTRGHGFFITSHSLTHIDLD
jgi:hypothetical protein